jgi:hypothetical protein
MSTVLLIPLGVGEAFTARYYTWKSAGQGSATGPTIAFLNGEAISIRIPDAEAEKIRTVEDPRRYRSFSEVNHHAYPSALVRAAE